MTEVCRICRRRQNVERLTANKSILALSSKLEASFGLHMVKTQSHSSRSTQLKARARVSASFLFTSVVMTVVLLLQRPTFAHSHTVEYEST